MVKPLTFKGEKRPKKRKHIDSDHIEAKFPAYERAPATGASSAEALANDAPTDTASHAKDLSRHTDADYAGNNEDGEGGDDSWVNADVPTDISGPILLVLPTEPVTALASDANGSVFASQIENMVEGDARTAEPHEVRQVWVATKIVGTEMWNLKGHHGKYLSADKVGLLSARREAISPEETFVFVSASDDPGGFGLQTARDTFIAAETSDGPEASLRGDADSVTFKSTLRVRMQARYKPRLKAHKAEKARGKISRKELEALVGRKLEDEEVRRLKRARREGDFHERVLDAKVKGKHDRFA